MEEDGTISLASLSLTHVYYNPDDYLSHVCAYLALIPQGLVIVYVALLICCRELEIGLMFAGQLVCEAANFALKRLIKEERPKGQMTVGKGYGMPSSHAQFVAFWSVYLILFMMMRHTPRLSHPASFVATGATSSGRSLAAAWGSYIERVSVSAVSVVIAAAVAWSRIYLGYHTLRQVLAGCSVGVVCAVGWFAVTAIARQMGLLDWAIEQPLSRLFRIRDLILTEDPAQAGDRKSVV